MNPIFEAMRVVTDFFMIYLKSIKQTNRPGMVWRTEGLCHGGDWFCNAVLMLYDKIAFIWKEIGQRCLVCSMFHIVWSYNHLGPNKSLFAVQPFSLYEAESLLLAII